MKAARLLELRAQVKEAPEGVAVRIDSQELAWLLETRDGLVRTAEALVKEVKSNSDYRIHSGPNFAMRLMDGAGAALVGALAIARPE